MIHFDKCDKDITSRAAFVFKEYGLGYAYRKNEENKDIYAFAFTEITMKAVSMCKPTKGMIINGKFFEYGKNGKLKKNSVGVGYRIYTDTYNEAVEGFNVLVKDRIKMLKNETDRLEELLIE